MRYLRHVLSGITVRDTKLDIPFGVSDTDEIIDTILRAFPGIRDEEEVKLHYNGMGSRPSVWTFGRIYSMSLRHKDGQTQTTTPGSDDYDEPPEWDGV